MRIGTRIEIWIQSWRFLLHMANHLFFIVWISTHHRIFDTPHRNSILFQFFGWLFQALQTLANQWLSNYHINTISCNIMPLMTMKFTNICLKANRKWITLSRIRKCLDVNRIWIIFNPSVLNAPFLFPWKYQKTVRCIGNKWVKAFFWVSV